MKKKILIIPTLLLFIFTAYGQEPLKQKKERSFSVFIESPLFYKSWNEYSAYIFTGNFEYLIKQKENRRLSLLIGFGVEYSAENYHFEDYFVHAEINKLFGKRNRFFEVGTGFGLAGLDPFLKMRLGYRCNVGRRLLFRIAYTPAVYLEPHSDTEEYPYITGFHALSLSFGYRFCEPAAKK